MNITRGLPSAPFMTPPVLTIGNFDGPHLGHYALVEAVVKKACQVGGLPIVLSFDPHPVQVLRPNVAHQFLSDTQDKCDFFERLGVAELLLLPFTRDLADLQPEEFVWQILSQSLGVRHVLVGENFVFGKNRRGTIQDLMRLGETANFEVHPVQDVMLEGEVVSSTRIRRRLKEGKVREGRRCLGRPYRLAGTVIEGEKRGSQLGWPTANLKVASGWVLPADGIYATVAEIDGDHLPSVTYIGTRPTFQEHERLLEVHVFDQVLQLYGKNISVFFIDQVREDRTFSTVDGLIDQMNRDGLHARQLLTNYRNENPDLVTVTKGTR